MSEIRTFYKLSGKELERISLSYNLLDEIDKLKSDVEELKRQVKLLSEENKALRNFKAEAVAAPEPKKQAVQTKPKEVSLTKPKEVSVTKNIDAVSSPVIIHSPISFPLKFLKKGDNFKFGRWYNDREIVWQILEKNDSEITAITRDCICEKIYDKFTGSWKRCYLNSWLNGAFYNRCFNEKEKSAIVKYCTDFLDNTCDNIWLLSETEVKYYFPTEKERRAFLLSENTCSWWLRTKNQGTCKIVSRNGQIVFAYGLTASYGVRPAIKIKV